MRIYTKEELKAELVKIRNRGFIPNARHGNDGGIGNTLEDLLGIPENNLPIPNAAEWELKTQRIGTKSLLTLFHMEPSPTALKLVSSQLLPLYGWRHMQAGLKYPETEMSFRQTIHGLNRSDRGFQVIIDEQQKKLLISFDAKAVSSKHSSWLGSVRERVGLAELNPQPYWGFDDLFHKAGTKLLNCFYIQAQVKREQGQQLYHYTRILVLRQFSLAKFLEGIKKGDVLVDFDARTGHNHGTKFRIRQNSLPDLYALVEEV
jgi:hypothetical protein